MKTLLKRLLPHRREYYLRMLLRRTSPRDVRKALDRLELRPGEVVLVHSSFSTLGYFSAGADGLIRVLREAIGSTGTLVMPSFPFTGSMEDYVASEPVFDIRSTPSRSGLVTEVFRRLPASLRSLHPTHPVCAAGPQAEALTAAHEFTKTPCGPNSPLGRLAGLDARVLRFGTGSLTLYHHIQELVDFPNLYLERPADLKCLDRDGREVRVRTRVYRKRIPQLLFLDQDRDGQRFSVHPSDFPLLYRGDREATYRSDPSRRALLDRLIRIRADFEAEGNLVWTMLGPCILELFPVRAYRDFAVREIGAALERHREKYDLAELESLERAGGYAR